MQHLAEFFEQGGFFMYVNLICSAITIAIIVERTIFFLGKGSVNAKAFLEQIRKLVAANNVDRAIKLCSATEAPVARVAKAGLHAAAQGRGGGDHRDRGDAGRRHARSQEAHRLALVAGQHRDADRPPRHHHRPHRRLRRRRQGGRRRSLDDPLGEDLRGHEQHLARPGDRRDLHDRPRVPQRRVEEAAARARGVLDEAREPARRDDAARQRQALEAKRAA